MLLKHSSFPGSCLCQRCLVTCSGRWPMAARTPGSGLPGPMCDARRGANRQRLQLRKHRENARDKESVNSSQNWQKSSLPLAGSYEPADRRDQVNTQSHGKGIGGEEEEEGRPVSWLKSLCNQNLFFFFCGFCENQCALRKAIWGRQMFTSMLGQGDMQASRLPVERWHHTRWGRRMDQCLKTKQW